MNRHKNILSPFIYSELKDQEYNNIYYFKKYDIQDLSSYKLHAIDNLFSIENNSENPRLENLYWEQHTSQLFDINDDSTENIINNSRSETLDKKYTDTLLTLLKEEDFEFGYKTRSEELILEQLSINAMATRNWLNEIFIKNFSNENIIIGILRIIGRFETSMIFPQGQTIAIAALTHKNDEIKELGVRAFEQWVSETSLDILKNIEVDAPWLKEYVAEVIQDLEEHLNYASLS